MGILEKSPTTDKAPKNSQYRGFFRDFEFRGLRILENFGNFSGDQKFSKICGFICGFIWDLNVDLYGRFLSQGFLNEDFSWLGFIIGI